LFFFGSVLESLVLFFNHNGEYGAFSVLGRSIYGICFPFWYLGLPIWFEPADYLPGVLGAGAAAVLGTWRCLTAALGSFSAWADWLGSSSPSAAQPDREA